ncbi:MAG: ABC transporter permease [Sulfolobales archaeon]
MIDTLLIGNFIFLTLKNAVPLILASTGEVIAERSGVINLGVEGSMIVGALVGVVATSLSGNFLIGFIAGGLTGLLLASLHGLVTVIFGANQIVSGIAVTMTGLGLTSLLGRGYVGKSLYGLRPTPLYPFDILLPDNIRPLITAVLKHDVIVYVSILIPFIVMWLLFKTKLGSSIRACGESPVIAESLGVNVIFIRFSSVLMGGFLSGLGGAYLSLGVVGTWVDNITAGVGWIAVGLVAFSMWMPIRALLASYLMAALISMSYILQGKIGISSYFLSMTPYIATVIILVLVSVERFRMKVGAPNALGKPYIREERLG